MKTEQLDKYIKQLQFNVELNKNVELIRRFGNQLEKYGRVSVKQAAKAFNEFGKAHTHLINTKIFDSK